MVLLFLLQQQKPPVMLYQLAIKALVAALECCSIGISWAKSCLQLKLLMYLCPLSSLAFLQAPVVLRLVFHDSGTYSAAAQNGGANASIQHELDRPENFGLKRGWKVIQTAMFNIQGTPAEGLVSYADMIGLVGAYAVAMCGGPSISIPIGGPHLDITLDNRYTFLCSGYTIVVLGPLHH